MQVVYSKSCRRSNGQTTSVLIERAAQHLRRFLFRRRGSPVVRVFDFVQAVSWVVHVGTRNVFESIDVVLHSLFESGNDGLMAMRARR